MVIEMRVVFVRKTKMGHLSSLWTLLGFALLEVDLLFLRWATTTLVG